jgi:hypothetical protein
MKDKINTRHQLKQRKSQLLQLQHLRLWRRLKTNQELEQYKLLMDSNQTNQYQQNQLKIPGISQLEL